MNNSTCSMPHALPFPRDSATGSPKPEWSHSCSHKSTKLLPLVWMSCGKTVGSLCNNEMKKLVFSTCPMPKHRWWPQDQTSNTGEKKKVQLVTERRDIYLAQWPLSYFLLTGRRHFNFTAYKKIPIRKLRFPVRFYCIFQSWVMRAGHIPMGIL